MERLMRCLWFVVCLVAAAILAVLFVSGQGGLWLGLTLLLVLVFRLGDRVHDLKAELDAEKRLHEKENKQFLERLARLEMEIREVDTLSHPEE